MAYARPCIFEHIYMARADSVLDGRLVYNSRKAMGVELAKEHPADADMVIGVPDSGIPAAVGYAEESGIPFEEGLIKNRYVLRDVHHAGPAPARHGRAHEVQPPAGEYQRQTPRGGR